MCVTQSAMSHVITDSSSTNHLSAKPSVLTHRATSCVIPKCSSTNHLSAKPFVWNKGQHPMLPPTVAPPTTYLLNHPCNTKGNVPGCHYQTSCQLLNPKTDARTNSNVLGCHWSDCCQSVNPKRTHEQRSNAPYYHWPELCQSLLR